MNICELCQLSSPSGCAKLNNESCLKDALKLLKRNVTNGDVMKVLFPSIEYNEANYSAGIVAEREGRVTIWDVSCSYNWWNTPYKGGDKDVKNTD